ncbi:MAG: cell division protein ZapA, partial [Candidatus Zixiibacteriota bacterium]
AEDPERIVRVAAHVDKRMRQVAENSHLSSHSDIAVLAALNITNELFDTNYSVNEAAEDLEERAQTILVKLEESLPKLEVVRGVD